MSLKSDKGSPERRKSRRGIWICVGVVLGLATAATVVVAILFAKNIIHIGSGSGSQGAAASGSATATAVSSPGATSTTGSSPSATSTPGPQKCATKDDVPSEERGTYLDPTTWVSLTDFNCSFTSEKVGGLSLLGLNSTWDDSARANPNVPPLNEAWGAYTSRPIRGVNLGGWLSLEPFITPSLFDLDPSLGIVDEWSLCSHLGKDAASTLEKHYDTFITEADFKAIAAAGLDHVRIPFSYWAVATYDDDAYVLGVSWRFLLRGIEWARKYGLRINLDLHGVPGSQNGWNHSGRSSKVNWISGPDGAKNAQRTLDIHDQLSKFFAQDRYKNIVAFYGLVNEPAKAIPTDALVQWTANAFKVVKDNGVTAPMVMSEAIRGLPTWQGKLTGYGDGLVVDAHEYVIFNNDLIAMKHAAKIDFACHGWVGDMAASMDTGTGFGPTMVGEWSQADTDCARFLNGVGAGARWDGSFAGSAGPNCAAKSKSCSCTAANADPSTYSEGYKLFLRTWAEAQMDAFEKSWGWFYWTWKSEAAPLWSYQAGLEGKFMPPVAYQRDWDCSKPVPSFGDLVETF